MNNHSTSFDGEEILIEMKKDLVTYKNKPNSRQFIIDQKQKLIERLYNVLSKNSSLKLYNIYSLLEKEIDSALIKDTEIGVVNVYIPVRYNKKQTYFINLAKIIEQNEK